MKYVTTMTEPFAAKQRCRCGKVAFDKKTAQTKKNWLQEHGTRQKKLLRIYQCPKSNLWHLTSKNVK